MFKLSLLTPEKKVLLDQEITEITVPMQSGERQILPGHVPMVANLGTGILAYKVAGDDLLSKCVISWGYCEVNSDGVNILAEFVQSKEEINTDESQKLILNSTNKLAKEILSDDEFEKALTDIKKSESALRLLN